MSKRRLIRKAKVDLNKLASAISHLTIGELRQLINKLNSETNGGWEYITPHDMDELDDYFKFTSVRDCLQTFTHYEFDIDDPYWVFNDNEPTSYSRGGLHEWIASCTGDFIELADDVMRHMNSKSFRDGIPNQIKNLAMTMETNKKEGGDE